MEDGIGVVDRISELPDFIIHHIMSYLSSEKVAQMSVLSRRWNYLRISFPILVFNRWKKKNSPERTDEFIRSVDASILRFCELQVPLQKFRLCMTLHDVEGVTSLLDKWIELAVAHEVKELDFNVKMDSDSDGDGDGETDSDGDVETNGDGDCETDSDGDVETDGDDDVETDEDEDEDEDEDGDGDGDGDGGGGDGDGNGNDNSMYSLPETVFSAKFVTILKLRNCNLEQSSGTIRFQSLKKLVLNMVRIDEQMVQKFIRGCPLLEDLFLAPIWHSDSVCVSPAPKLKILTIDLSSSFSNVDIIEIVSPSLQKCTIISVLSLCVIDMAGCYDLKYLDLTDAAISDEDFHNLILKFPLLEELILRNCSVEKIAFSSNRLRELEVHNCDKLISIDIDAPSLLTFSHDCITYPASINIPRTCSWTARFRIGGNCDILVTFDRIKELLKVPYEIEKLSISIYVVEPEDSFTLEEFKKRSPSVPHREVGNLTIDFLSLPPSKYAALLDCLLWICHPRILSIKYSSESSPTKEFIEWFYKKMTNRDAECCNRHGIKCWQYYLRDFKIESFIPFEEPEPHHIDNLMVMLPELEAGTIRFHLDWCFS